MPTVLRLEAREFAGLTRWRWVLTEAAGTFLADHEVHLDERGWQFEAAADLHGYISWHAAPDRYAVDEARIVHQAGAWLGERVLGPAITQVLVHKRPATVQVIIPPGAEALAALPLDLSHADGRPLARHDVTLVTQTGTPDTATCTKAGTPQPAPSAAAGAIPADYLALFRQTGREYGIPWPVLAGIGEVESGDGANQGPSSAGALGPMQFLPSTWKIYGNGGSITNPADAIPAAARLLLANGAPGNLPAAIFAYNNSSGYVQDVLGWASKYASGGYTVNPNQQPDCTLEALRQAPSAIAAQIIRYALQQVGKPYIWGGTGPDGFDCSGLIYAAYRSVGITLPRTTFGMWDLTAHVPEKDAQPGDIVFFNTGPGTAPNHPGHAGLVIGNGQMVIARCTTCGPITTVSYLGHPALVGFVRPLADPAISAQVPRHLANRHVILKVDLTIRIYIATSWQWRACNDASASSRWPETGVQHDCKATMVRQVAARTSSRHRRRLQRPASVDCGAGIGQHRRVR